MKKNFLATLCIGASLGLLTACGSATGEVKPYNEGINIIPMPQSLVQQDGFFKLSSGTKFGVTSPEAKTIAEFFAAKMSQSTGYQITVAEQGNITLTLNPELEMNDEGYTLDITSNSVQIAAKTAQGLFYGMQSFMQLLPAEIESAEKVEGIEWRAQAVSIKDEPRFEYRGMMLDPCRHFVSVEHIKKYIDVLSLFKINRMHWHLTDDQGWRIEIKKYPKLTEIGSKRIDGEGTEYGGYYTQEEIKEVVKYAADRFITVVPELEMPGHGMAAIAAYPELSCKGEKGNPRIIWGVEDVVFCPGKESTFQFLQDVIDEMVPLFPSEYFHIGGDECPKANWKTCPACQKRIATEGLKADKGHTAEERLQSYVIRRIEKYLETKGKKLIGWDEILEGGLAPSATVMSWRGEEGGIAAALTNHTVIMTPGGNGMYLDHYQGDSKIEPVTIGGYSTLEKTYSYNPMPDTLVAMRKEEFILGVQGNVWSEYIYSDAKRDYMTFPRILAVAEIGWTPVDRKDFSDFSRRINNACVRLDQYGINYHIPMPEQPNGSCNTVAFVDSTSLEFTTTRPMQMVYTLDGSEPTAASPVYSSALSIDQTTTIKAKGFKEGYQASRTLTIQATKAEFRPALSVSAGKQGTAYTYVEGYFQKVADLKNGKVIEKGVMPEPSIKNAKQPDHFGYTFEGLINVPEEGVYTFYTRSDDGSVLYIDGEKIVDNDASHAAISATGRIALQKGFHSYKLLYFEDYEGEELGWGWKRPSGNKMENIPANLLYVK